jgi:hypothetical protein
MLQHQEESIESSMSAHQTDSKPYKSYLPLEKLKASSSARADMAQFILSMMLSHNGRGISTTNDNDCTFFGCLDVGVEEACGAFRECGEFKDTRGPVLQAHIQLRILSTEKIRTRSKE